MQFQVWPWTDEQPERQLKLQFVDTCFVKTQLGSPSARTIKGARSYPHLGYTPITMCPLVSNTGRGRPSLYFRPGLQPVQNYVLFKQAYDGRSTTLKKETVRQDMKRKTQLVSVKTISHSAGKGAAGPVGPSEKLAGTGSYEGRQDSRDEFASLYRRGLA